MAYISFQPSDYFNTKLYTGTGSSNALTGVGFQPDIVWIKERDGTNNHNLFDSVRGAGKLLKTDNDTAEGTTSEGVKSFDSDGFTCGTNSSLNGNGQSFVSWNWKAGTTSGINTTGADITPSSYSMSATSGISIIKYTGNGTDGAKIAHALGDVPEMMIIKRLDNSNYWAVFQESDVTDYLVFNTSAAFSDAPIWKDTAPTSVYYQTDNSGSVNASGDNLVAYCFKSIKGFSHIGTYRGNGNADGPFCYTGFRPAFLLAKCSSTTSGGAGNWYIFDSKRAGYNIANYSSKVNDSDAEATSAYLDLLSNGFKIRNAAADLNGSGTNMIYLAFSEFPVVSSNSKSGTAQ